MIQNYLKITLRHFWSNKAFSFLNLAGLATGITCAVLILLWVENELTYNAFHEKKDGIYQIMNNQTYEGKTYTFSATPGPLRAALEEEVPGIQYISRMDWNDNSLVSYGDKNIYERNYGVEPDFFRIFSFKLLRGEPETVFQDIHSIVVTESFAKKYFGSEDPVGKIVKIDKETDFKVTGVVTDPPQNSSIKFAFLKPFELFLKRNPWTSNWGTNGMQTMVALHPGADVANINKTLDSIIVRHHEGATSRLFLFSVNDWRLRSNFKDGKIAGGRIEHVKLFSLIAAFILLIACINFMNLSTARSERRAREVGVRKVMGAGKGALVRQFLGESLMLAILSVASAALLVELVLPNFNELVGAELSLRLTDTVHLTGLLAIGLITGLMAGSYPSVYLSSFQPVRVIKGLVSPFGSLAKGSGTVRKVLVVAQFAISCALIISTIVIYQQVHHVKSRHLGFDKEHLVILPLRGEMEKKFPVIKKELMDKGAIVNAALTNQQLVVMGNNTSNFSWQGKDPNSEVLITTDWVSPEFLGTMGIKLKEGRDFNPNPDLDTSSVIINETFVNIIGRDNLLGEEIDYGDTKYRVIGIMENFLFNNIYEDPDPVAIFSRPVPKSFMFTRLSANRDLTQTLAGMETTFSKHNPGYPFDYKFVDNEFNELFQSETLISQLARLFAGLAIFISCLGLFGLAAFMAERRTKEIGIRKVLGASVASVVGLLSQDFLKLVFVAFVIASPLAWYFMNKWLADFAYRINIGWWVFAAAGIIAVTIAFLTVSFQSLKAALANPVKSLRSE